MEDNIFNPAKNPVSFSPWLWTATVCMSISSRLISAVASFWKRRALTLYSARAKDYWLALYQVATGTAKLLKQKRMNQVWNQEGRTLVCCLRETGEMNTGFNFF